MTLPGKLCIGILEEDNPLKSYFRFKPILIRDGERFSPFDAPEEYPADGCIRIVPDKNESSLFKARMRRIGLFAAVDLTEHPGENDKIRANKNYRNDEAERNAYIIYSDVVREPQCGMLYCVLNAEPDEAESLELPQQPLPRVLLRQNGALLGQVWHCAAEAGEGQRYRMKKSGEEIDPVRMLMFDLALPEGQTMTLAVCLSAPNEEVKTAFEPERPREEKAEERPPRVEPRAVPTYSQALAEQCGLNPRRGRSLKEIIDEKWRASRIEALGALVPEMQDTQPTEAPVERALKALRMAWANPEQRAALVGGLAEFENLDATLNACRAAARESLISKQLVDLEAQRLEALKALDDLRKGRIDIREELKAEIRRSEEREFADAVEKTRRAREEQRRTEEEAQNARAAAESAQDVLNALSDGRFEKKLNEFALTSRAVELLRRLDNRQIVPPAVNGCDADREELIRRTMSAFENAGAPIVRAEAIHLLICAAQSPMLLFLGAPGSGKTRAARLLANALGVSGDRLRFVAPGKEPVEFAKAPGDALHMAVLDDANLIQGDFCRGLAEKAARGELLLVATAQDDAYPIAAHVLDRAFAIRLSALAVDAPWKPAECGREEECPPVSLETLRAAFPIQQDAIPESVCARMERLRSELALVGVHPSRRTLNAVWNYLSAAIPALGGDPMELLDRAIAERMLPAILAGARVEALRALPGMVRDLPACAQLFEETLPVNV